MISLLGGGVKATFGQPLYNHLNHILLGNPPYITTSTSTTLEEEVQMRRIHFD
jgi:hypothetical protein